MTYSELWKNVQGYLSANLLHCTGFTVVAFRRVSNNVQWKLPVCMVAHVYKSAHADMLAVALPFSRLTLPIRRYTILRLARGTRWIFAFAFLLAFRKSLICWQPGSRCYAAQRNLFLLLEVNRGFSFSWVIYEGTTSVTV